METIGLGFSTKLVLSGNWAYVEDADVYQMRTLAGAMRYQVPGFEYSPKFLANKWDGWRNLFEWNPARFPRGLLSKALTIESLAGRTVEVVEENPPYREIDVSLRPDVTPYPFQVECVKAGVTNRRGVVAVATGGGKSLIACMLLVRWRVPTLIMVMRKEHLYQWRNEIAYRTDYPRTRIGIYGDGVKKIEDVTIAMTQSVDRLHDVAKRAFLERFSCIIIDEAHHAPCDQIAEALKDTQPLYLIGLSATPEREDGNDMMITGLIGPVIIRYSCSDLIELGILARPVIRIRNVPPKWFSRSNTYDEVYTAAIVANEDRNEIIAQEANDLFNQCGSVYIHVRHINHGERLAGMIPRATWICGETPAEERMNAIARFKSEGGILISTLLGEGTDVPGMRALILACGGKSLLATRQVVGRVLRIAKDKTSCRVLDLRDNCKYLDEHSDIRFGWYESERAFRLED